MNTFNSTYFSAADRTSTVELPPNEPMADARIVMVVSLGVLVLTALAAVFAP